jgi:hypothetical protein
MVAVILVVERSVAFHYSPDQLASSAGAPAEGGVKGLTIEKRAPARVRTRAVGYSLSQTRAL